MEHNFLIRSYGCFQGNIRRVAKVNAIEIMNSNGEKLKEDLISAGDELD